MDCGSWSVVGTTEDGEKVVVPLSCRSWACRSCRRRNKRKLLSRLVDVQVTTFVTLTCNPRVHSSPDDAFRRMSLHVNSLVKRIRRQWPDTDLEYFLVWERTKAGWPHAHLLLRAPYIPQRWLSYAWKALTGAPIVDIRKVGDKRSVVSYIAKYLSKDPQAPQGMKRYRCSRRFFGPVVTAGPLEGRQVLRWTVAHSSAHEIARQHVLGGWSAQAQPDGSFVIVSPTHYAQLTRGPSLTDHRLVGSLQ